MKKHLLLILLFSQLTTSGQPFVKEKFITYETVIKELKTTENIKSLENKFNYTFVLLLDSSNFGLIERTGYQYIEDYRDLSHGLSLSKRTVGFVTDKKDIKEIFIDKKSLKRILDCTNLIDSPDKRMSEFNFPIYIKDNKAIFEISGSTWSGTYFARLEKGILQINWLGGIIK